MLFMNSMFRLRRQCVRVKHQIKNLKLIINPPFKIEQSYKIDFNNLSCQSSSVKLNLPCN